MIRPVDSPAAPKATQASASTQPASGKSFAALLSAKEKGAVPDIPAGETWQPVSGHRGYAKIISGPRRGMYINLTMNNRHGEAFKLEHRGAKDLHVYASGTVVVARAEHHPAAARPAADQPPKGEVWAPVPGTTAWADILGGPRDGLFVNTSGNNREGMAFQVIHHGGKTFHMYGSGPHRLMVEVISSHPPAAAATPSAPAGGVAAPAH